MFENISTIPEDMTTLTQSCIFIYDVNSYIFALGIMKFLGQFTVFWLIIATYLVYLLYAKEQRRKRSIITTCRMYLTIYDYDLRIQFEFSME